MRPISIEAHGRQARRGSRLLLQFRGVHLLLQRLPLGARGQAFFDARFHIGLRRFKETQRIGKLDLLPGIEVQKAAQTEERSLACGLRFQQALAFVLQLHIGAQRIDSRAYSFFLQVRGLVEERLRQVHARLRSLDVRHGAQRSDILRDDQQNYLLACGEAVFPAGFCRTARSLVAPEQCQIEKRSIDRRARGKNGERPEVPGYSRK